MGARMTCYWYTLYKSSETERYALGLPTELKELVEKVKVINKYNLCK